MITEKMVAILKKHTMVPKIQQNLSSISTTTTREALWLDSWPHSLSM